MSSRRRRAYTKRLKRARLEAEQRAEYSGKERAGYSGVRHTTATTPIDGPLGMSRQYADWKSCIAPVKVNRDTIRVRRSPIGSSNPGKHSERGVVCTVVTSDGMEWGKRKPDGTIGPERQVPLLVKVRCNSRGLREFARFCTHYEIATEQLDTDLFLAYTLGGEDESRLRNHPSVLKVETMINGDKVSRAQGQSKKQ